MVLAVAIVVAILFLAGGFALSRRADKVKSWNSEIEGFLAVATPCCTKASFWEELDAVTADGQRARPASIQEAAQWLNDWPYRNRHEHDMPHEGQLSIAAQSSEVRCVGAPTGPEIRPEGPDQQTLKAIRYRRECTYAKWKVWNAETAKEHLNERHTVWVDEGGFFRGRVDYWR